MLVAPCPLNRRISRPKHSFSAMDDNCEEVSSAPKPIGVIRLKIKRRHSESRRLPRKPLKTLNGGGSRQDERLQSAKRKNPFRCTPRKKANLLRNPATNENKLFRALDGVDTDCIHNKVEEKRRRVAEDDKPIDTEPVSDTSDSFDGEDAGPEERGQAAGFPLDWSLKTKARFVSDRPFSWYKTLTASEESKGLTDFVRCCNANKDSSTNNHRCAFYRNTMLWMHPCLPWLNLFPRQCSDRTAGKSSLVRQLDQPIVDSLLSDWVASFRSAFNSLRSGCCPYFYLVANQCNVLFQAPTVTGTPSVRVVMTPTTQGLRESLAREGISFSMPHLLSEKTGAQQGDQACDQDSGDEGDWLQSVGLDTNSFPDLDPSHMSQAQLRQVDQQPSSTVVVNGNDAQALFNFLLNCKSLVTNTGLLAGVPPTLLAPVAFEGAALQKLKVRQGTLKQNHAKGFKQVHSLEVVGPILPSCVNELCRLLQDTQQGQFAASFSVHQLSVALNIPSLVHQEPQESSHKCQLSADQLGSGESTVPPNSCMKELHCQDSLFTWKGPEKS